MLSKDDVKLVTMSISDSYIVRKWRNDEESYKYFFSYENISYEAQLEWAKHALNDKTQINWMIIKNHKKVGTIALQNIDLRNGKAEMVRLIIDNSFKRKGIAYDAENLLLEYAFNYLRLNKVYCYTYVDNKPVIDLHTKFGFKIIGVHKEHIYRKGKYVNVNILELLKEDYEKMVSNTVK